MRVGIAACHCHFPRSRIDAATLRSAWGSSPRGLQSKRVAGIDEDALTLALAAASAVKVERPPTTLALASNSLPYRRRVQAGLLARGLGLASRVFVMECTTSRRAGTEALIAAAHVLTGAEDADGRGVAEGSALVVAGEVATGPVDGGDEASRGAGAAALVLHAAGGLATIDGVASHVQEDPGLDFVRAGEEVRRDVDVPDYAVDAYVGSVQGAVSALLATVGREVADYRFVALDHPDQRMVSKAARALGLESRQWQGSRAFPATGDVGAAQSILELVAALDASRPGERILLVSYGGGSAADAVSLVAGPDAGGDRLARALEDAADLDYTTYLKLRGEI